MAEITLVPDASPDETFTENQQTLHVTPEQADLLDHLYALQDRAVAAYRAAKTEADFALCAVQGSESAVDKQLQGVTGGLVSQQVLMELVAEDAQTRIDYDRTEKAIHITWTTPAPEVSE